MRLWELVGKMSNEIEIDLYSSKFKMLTCLNETLVWKSVDSDMLLHSNFANYEVVGPIDIYVQDTTNKIKVKIVVYDLHLELLGEEK